MNGHRNSAAVARARALLDGLPGQPLRSAELALVAARVAGFLFEAAEAHKSETDRQGAVLLGRLMEDPDGQAFSNLLSDRAYRSRDPERIVGQVRHLLECLGTPAYLSPAERLQLGAVRAVGAALPQVVARAMLHKLRERTRSVILSSEEPVLSEHLARRRGSAVRMNLNWLGEAVLGEDEAERRVEGYGELLARDDVEAVSIKVSTICSQLNLLAWDETLARLRPRLRKLYRAALTHRFRRADGSEVPKLVNLDMEAYRDLHLTVALFRSLLEEEEFSSLPAGLALQAYLPDSFAVQEELTRWALARVAAGGAPIRLRLVKGANLAAESVESSLRGWTVPVYATKAEVDANFKRMVTFGCQPEHVRGVELGIASHNVFDIAYAMTLRAWQRIESGVGFELLEGMADHLRRAVQEVADDVLVYGPVVGDEAMQCAIAYLIRRLDENTAPDNFLRNAFTMRVGDQSWRAQRRQFLRACRRQDVPSTDSRRLQNRNRAPVLPAAVEFANEPDTDFSLPCNRKWIHRHLDRIREAPPSNLAMQIGGHPICRRPWADGFDPSRPEVIPYRYPLATAAEVEQALECAAAARATWHAVLPETRAAILARIAHGLRVARGALVAAMVLDAGKRVTEADAEVSEAIDFAEYYRRSFLALSADDRVRAEPKGVGLVTPPWNFPLAIPAGGTLAALVAGNPVILKPALETPLVTERFARICWQAGVPKEVLQLVFCTDRVASALVADERVAFAVLTGATSTAQLFHDLKPDLDLMAETGGKNTLIVTSLADRDLAVQSAVQSAFGHAGQKCSAMSLLICEAEVYDDPAFRETLRDAATSLRVGPAWDLDSVVTPLIRPPTQSLLRGLTELEAGESWLLEPRPDPENPRLWTPGIKLGVREGSYTHVTEFFGPLLGVVRAESLAEALRIANGTPYGLTAGLCSLDEREQVAWLDRMRAGNLYVNRGTTGAVVRRQPFGGVKASCFGPGAKAGGPNYVAQMVRLRDHSASPERGTPPPIVDLMLSRLRELLATEDWTELEAASVEYAAAFERHFAVDHDPSQLLGQVNVFCYRPLERIVVRLSSSASARDTSLACAAALTCSDQLELTVHPDAERRLTWLRDVPGTAIRVETAAGFARRLTQTSGYFIPPGAPPRIERIRSVGTDEPLVIEAAHQAGVHVATAPPLRRGRWELLHYVREQSICIDYHRYGNLSAAILLPVGEREHPADTATAADDDLADVG